MMKVLIVQSEPMQSSALNLTLRKEGYEVFFCKNEKSVENKLSEINPDVVIADIMPYTAGLEVLCKIKMHKEKEIPVIVLSAIGDEATLQQAFDLGADDYVLLPFSLTELSMRVNIQAKWKVKAMA